MKKEQLQQLDVGTQQQDLVIKPYGFCCNIKDEDSRLFLPKEKTGPLFPTSDPISGGPDIKVRIEEHEDDLLFTQKSGRGGQRGGLRGGQRGGHRSRHRSGQINWGDQSRGRQRRQRDAHRGGPPRLRIHRRPILPLGEQMKCKRCRGPLQWFLEDEIDVALEKMMNKRQQTYNSEMKKNIKLSKEKEKRTHTKRKRGTSKVKEDTVKDDTVNEDTLKEDAQEEEMKINA